MCGIMGYVGQKSCVDLIFSGLQKLEYRGYDSSGIAVIDTDAISMIKSVGKLAKLKPLLPSLPSEASIGMGHTRWATHGVPSTENAHPHTEQGISIVHNGILENYKELKIQLLQQGVKFSSQTDSEVIVHLLNAELEIAGDLKKAILNVIPRLEGAFALGVLSIAEPKSFYLVKQGSPLVIGLAKDEHFFASDPLALREHCQEFIFLEDGEVAKVTQDDYQIWSFLGAPVSKEPHRLDWSLNSAEKGGHRHYMHKEIHDQPKVFSNTIERMVNSETLNLRAEAFDLSELDFAKVSRIHLIGCGTSFYAGLLGKYTLEPLLKTPCEVELASEFRYRSPYLDEATLVIAITQSGETADTLASIKHAKSMGCQILSICNVEYSSIPRESHATLYMEAGPEIGVASTKAFTSMVLNLHLLGLYLAQTYKRQPLETLHAHMEALVKLPHLAGQIISKEHLISDIARHYFEDLHCLFIGRNTSFPVAMEGALKLKEVSYIHAEGYAGGELKHGPIALIDKHMPIVAIAPMDHQYEKMLSNIEEVCARQGRVLGVGSEEDDRLASLCERVIPCPDIGEPIMQAILSTIPLQIFSYYVAVHRGTDVDQPRNLAKSVTVE